MSSMTELHHSSRYFNDHLEISQNPIHFSSRLYQIQYELACLLSSEQLSRDLHPDISFVYNPLDYARDNYLKFVYSYANAPKKILFMGMNPGPWGMVQTGIPFGEVTIVRDWLKLNGDIIPPVHQHPSRLIKGFSCKRSEVSGKRFWALAKDISKNDPQVFFKNSFIYNYYPLALLSKSGKNITPPDLRAKNNIKLLKKSFCCKYLPKQILKMPNANGYGSIFPYPLDKEDMEYIQKGVQSIFQEMCGMNNNSWNNQCYTQSVKIPIYERTHGLNCTSSEHNYHVEGDNYNSESRPYYRSCKNEVLPKLQSHSTEKLFSDILSNGIDDEDMAYLKKSYYLLLWDKRESSWARQLQWIPHTTTSDERHMTTSHTELSEETGRLVSNRSGCARTEGYIKRVQKYSKMQATYNHQEAESATNGRVLPYSKTYKGNKQTLSRDARNDQRRLSTAYQTITHSNLLNLNELKFRKKKLKLGKSEIHGLGLFASEPIGPNEIIIEYVGQIIRPIIADLRENGYKQSGLGYYCFLIDDGTVVDATKYGNINRYINHSCNPNSYAKILVINNKKKIVIYSKRHIKVNEEITYDYKMKIEDEKIECLCKAPGCRKSLN